MLYHIERRRFLIKPSRERPLPAPVRLLHVELDEGSGELFVFPRRGRLARPQPHDHVLPADRLPGMQRDVLDDAVALVEDSQDRDTLCHRRYSALAIRRRGRLLRGGQLRVLLVRTLAARGERKRGEQRSSEDAHVYSGIQGS